MEMFTIVSHQASEHRPGLIYETIAKSTSLLHPRNNNIINAKTGNILPSFTLYPRFSLLFSLRTNVNKHFFNHTRLQLHLCSHCLSCHQTSIKFMECSCSYDNQGGYCGALFHCFTLFQKPKVPPQQSISFHSDLSAHTVLCK